MNERFAFDLAAAGADGACVAGADEAGRGCLAGPLAAAAVCLDYSALDEAALEALSGLDDSKRLSPPRREALYEEIFRLARQVVVVFFSPATIDRDGLHRCNLRGLARAVERVHPAPDVALVDGFPLPECTREHRAVVGGDRKSAAVAAASIVAKVTRDRVMRGLHESLSRLRIRQARGLRDRRSPGGHLRTRRLRAAPAVVRQRRLSAARPRTGRFARLLIPRPGR